MRNKFLKTSLLLSVFFLLIISSLIFTNVILLDFTFYIVSSLFIALNLGFIFSNLKSEKNNISAINELIAKIKSENLKLNEIENINIDNFTIKIFELENLIISEFLKRKKNENYRSEFLGNVSHELRTPLFTIQGLIETLLDGGIDDPKINKEFLLKALNNLARLDSLLKDLMEISKIESGELAMSPRYFEIGNLIDDVISESSSIAEKKKIIIEKQIQNPIYKIFADRDRIFQVLSNLLENAIKYSSDNTKIIIDISELEKQILFKVIDQGIGILEEHQPRIFERFYRVDKDRSRKVGGTGLGLSIAKHIIEAHKSTLKIESRLGSGSTFYFALDK